MRYWIIIFTLFATVLVYAFAGGIIGLTKMNGRGCTCHNQQPDSNVNVWIEGPDTLTAGETTIYKVYLTGGPGALGGFNAAAKSGTLNVIDTNTIKIDVELTHEYPLSFTQDTVQWSIQYTAPTSGDFDTLFAVSMSVNGNGFPDTLDRWNFSPDFPIKISPVVYVHDPSQAPEDFILTQNYPNPFNPSTTIKFSLPVSSEISLKLFTISGEEIKEIANGSYSAGSHKINLNAKGLTSGVYIYSLFVKGSDGSFYNESKKLTLLK